MKDLDLVLLMSVNPGFGGQTFIPSALAKVRQLREMVDHLDASCRPLISVDGGVKPGTIKPLVEAGIDVAVAGSAVFGSPDYAAAIALASGARGRRFESSRPDQVDENDTTRSVVFIFNAG